MRNEFFAAFENAGWPVLWLDAAGTVLRANDAAGQCLGPGVTSGSTRLAAFWWPDNPTPADRFLLQWTRTPTPTVTLRLRARGGQLLEAAAHITSWMRDQQRFFLFQLFPAPRRPSPAPRDEDAEIAGLKQRLECLQQFARTIALDFNNALTPVLSRTSLLLSRLAPDDPARPALLEIEQATARAAEIAHELGTFSRAGSETETAPGGNLNELIQRAIEVVRAKPTGARIEWSFEPERRLYTVHFSEAKLLPALVHVLDNAAEAIARQGLVRIRTRNLELDRPLQDRNIELAPGCHVCVEVTDTGCGIPPAHLPRVFEPFFTTKAEQGHRGLGLAWVYGVVTSHGGGITMVSEPGRGTTVRLYFPAQPVVARTVATTEPLLRGEGTVLVVDDDERVRRTVEAVRKQFGYKVVSVPGGEEALGQVRRNGVQVDVALVDLVMPRMGGRELIEHLRKLRPPLPIVPTTGYVLPAMEPAEPNGCLRKPFTAQELLWHIKEAVSKETNPTSLTADPIPPAAP